MLYLYEQSSGERLGSITDEQFTFLQNQMEEEYPEDRDYSITPMEIAYFEGVGADPELVALLRRALGERNEVIVRWSRS